MTKTDIRQVERAHQDADIERLQTENEYAFKELANMRAEIGRLQASLKMTNGGERELSAFLKLEAEVGRLRAAHRHIQGIAKQAEVYYARMGASQTFAAIADAAKAALEPKP